MIKEVIKTFLETYDKKINLKFSDVLFELDELSYELVKELAKYIIKQLPEKKDLIIEFNEDKKYKYIFIKTNININGKKGIKTLENINTNDELSIIINFIKKLTADFLAIHKEKESIFIIKIPKIKKTEINILITDDDEINIEITKALSEEYLKDIEINYNIYTAKNGLDALKIINSKKIDVVFLDILMPIMDGYETLYKIRHSKIQKQPIVIVLSALDDIQTKVFDLGANWYFFKPFDEQKLQFLLHDIIADKLNKNEFITNEETIQEDDFFFEEGEIDISYNTPEPISAKEFMQLNIIDIQEIEEIKELFEEYNYVIDENFYDMFVNLIEEFIFIFNSTYYLSNLAYALENLLLLLEKLDEEKKEKLKPFFESIIDDLNNFFNEVIIKKSAINIHYLDEALIANVTQIEMFAN
jgi:two-component system response regulator (stage 0 sporulation protein A)